MTVDEFLSSCRMTDGAKIVYLHLLRCPDCRATGAQLVQISGRGPASISRWTNQLATARMIDIKYNGCKQTIYVARQSRWVLEESRQTSDVGRQ